MSINGTAGNDILQGTNGNDQIYGLDGDDQLFGLGGNDTLVGGSGIDSMHGGTGSDLVDYRHSLTGWQIDLASDLAADLANSLTAATLEAVVSIEHVHGSQGNDRIYGDDTGNDLEGEDGDDRISGRGGDDSVEGENGNDHLDGGLGADTLIGGPGTDTMNGGSGSDRFVYFRTTDSPAGFIDTVQGFDGAGLFGASQDQIDLSRIDSGAAGGHAFKFWGELDDGEGLGKAPGALWVRNLGTDTWVVGNTDDDNFIELRIRITDGDTTAADYWSGDFVL